MKTTICLSILTVLIVSLDISHKLFLQEGGCVLSDFRVLLKSDWTYVITIASSLRTPDSTHLSAYSSTLHWYSFRADCVALRRKTLHVYYSFDWKSDHMYMQTTIITWWTDVMSVLSVLIFRLHVYENDDYHLMDWCVNCLIVFARTIYQHLHVQYITFCAW